MQLGPICNTEGVGGCGARVRRGVQVLAGERWGGWVLVSADGQVGWVSGDYLSGTRMAPDISVPVQS